MINTTLSAEERTKRNQLFERLNQIAAQYEKEGMYPDDAVTTAASDMDLEWVANDDDDMRSIYRAPDGMLVNAWIVGVQSDHVEDGGLGFDEFVEWYTDQCDQC